MDTKCKLLALAMAGAVSAPALAQDAKNQVLAQDALQQGEGVRVVTDPAAVREVERALSEQGLEPGPAEGIWDAESQQALESFQQKQGLDASGVLDAPTVTALGL